MFSAPALPTVQLTRCTPLRVAAERADAGCLPGESVIAATLRLNDPHRGDGLSEFDRQTLMVRELAALRAHVAHCHLADMAAEVTRLRDELADANELLVSYQDQLAAVPTRGR